MPPGTESSSHSADGVAANSRGAFGLEPLVGAVGPGLAVLLIVVTPFIWSLPMALMVAELATLLPEEGGYYFWVKETSGHFWAVQEAWWTMGYSLALVAVCPDSRKSFTFPISPRT